MKGPGFATQGSGFHKYQKVPDKLVDVIERAHEVFEKSLERLKKNRTLENVVFLCEDDRGPVLLLFLARASWNGSSHPKLFDEFHELEKAICLEE